MISPNVTVRMDTPPYFWAMTASKPPSLQPTVSPSETVGIPISRKYASIRFKLRTVI